MGEGKVLPFEGREKREQRKRDLLRLKQSICFNILDYTMHDISLAEELDGEPRQLIPAEEIRSECERLGITAPPKGGMRENPDAWQRVISDIGEALRV